MKKIAVIVMSIMLVLGLAACGNSRSNRTSTNKTVPSTTAGTTEQTTAEKTTAAKDSDQATEAETKDKTDDESKNETEAVDASAKAGTEDASNTQQTGKTLVVYYSASGNTERVAKDIAEAAGADLFEIVPTEVYTSDDLNWTNKDSRVSREHDDESLRDVPLTTTEVPDWDSYDTVFIGYPIWWGIAAWPVDGFVKANDFTGKTVIPFATSSSSGMGQSGTLLAQMAGTGDWQEGQRFFSGVSSADVQSWVKGLGL